MGIVQSGSTFLIVPTYTVFRELALLSLSSDWDWLSIDAVVWRLVY